MIGFYRGRKGGHLTFCNIFDNHIRKLLKQTLKIELIQEGM